MATHLFRLDGSDEFEMFLRSIVWLTVPKTFDMSIATLSFGWASEYTDAHGLSEHQRWRTFGGGDF